MPPVQWAALPMNEHTSLPSRAAPVTGTTFARRKRGDIGGRAVMRITAEERVLQR